jgi:hypothetical protein
VPLKGRVQVPVTVVDNSVTSKVPSLEEEAGHWLPVRMQNFGNLKEERRRVEKKLKLKSEKKS